MFTKKNVSILLLIVLLVGFAGVVSYNIWSQDRQRQSDEKAAAESDRIVTPVVINDPTEKIDLDSSTETESQTVDSESDEPGDQQDQDASLEMVPTTTPAPQPVSLTERFSGTWQSHRNYISEGGIEIIKTDDEVIIQTTSDYSFSGAPDPFLYLSDDQNQSIANAIPIGALQSNSGVQAYRVSVEEFESFDGSLVLWCERFNLYMGRADIESA